MKDLKNMTAQDLAKELCAEEIVDLSTSQDRIDFWKDKLPNLAKAMEKLNGTSVKSYMLDHPDMVAEILEEWLTINSNTFSEWIGKNGFFIHPTTNKWCDGVYRLIANTTADLYQIFKKESNLKKEE